MRSMTRKMIIMSLAVRAEAMEKIAPASPFGIKENPPGARRRKSMMMRVIKGMKRRPVSKSFRRPEIPYALTGVHLCTPPTANSSGGHEKSMPWN